MWTITISNPAETSRVYFCKYGSVKHSANEKRLQFFQCQEFETITEDNPGRETILILASQDRIEMVNTPNS
jgi:hypothetical protein